MSVVGQREWGVSDTIDFQRFEQVEPIHRYRGRIFYHAWNWSSHFRLDGQFTRGRASGTGGEWAERTDRPAKREQPETPALMDEFEV